MTGYRKIRVVRSDAVEIITLHYPERRNALGPEMVSELLYALDAAQLSDDVRVIVLTGEGGAFCAGGDFVQLSGAPEAPLPPMKGDYADLLLQLAHSEKPTVARVNGHAVGGGLGLVAACTFAVASSEAQFGTPEINVGLFPMMILPLLARLVPRRRLAEMILLGEKIDAHEAERIGLVTRVVSPSDLDRAVRELCSKIESKSPLIVRLGLRALAADGEIELENALPAARERFAECLATSDAREGLAAFLEKRKPNWVGS